MAALVKQARDKVIVRPRGDWNFTGKVFQTAGVAFAAVALPLGLWVAEQFFLLGIVGAILVVVGLPLVLAGKRTVLDVAERKVLLANGDVMGFDDVADVDLRTYIHEVSHSQQGSRQEQRFRVALVPKAADPNHAEHVEHARQAIEEAASQPDGKLTTSQQEALTNEISQIGTAMPAGEPIFFADHANELKMWRVAERVAKTLDVPIADYCGDELAIRTPAELDVPLGERLARMGGEVASPETAPGSVRDLSTDDRVHVSWGWPVWAGVIPAVALGIGFGLLGFFTWEDTPEFRIGFGAIGVAFLLLALFLFDGRRKAIEVTPKWARLHAGVWLRRSPRIPLSCLEMVRVHKTVGTALSLISDKRIVHCPTPADATDWVRQRIECFLQAQSDAQ